jgi:hypothetical protein
MARGITKAITRSTNWRWRRCRRISAFELTPALKDRIEFLAGEPDRWRNVGDLPLKHVNGPDHYIDLEDLKLYGLTPETLPMMRYDFVADIARARAAHPENFRRLTRTRTPTTRASWTDFCRGPSRRITKN